jgi:hypothetical protein
MSQLWTTLQWLQIWLLVIAPPWKISPRECVSYAQSDYFSNAHWPEDIMCQWPLVVCADVAATVHAPDCWHQSQQSALPFIQP